MDWGKFALKLPLVISGIVGIVNKVKGASKEDKLQAVLDSVPESVSLAEFSVDKDFLNDPAIAQLVTAVVDAEHVLQEARAALKQGVVNKGK